MKYPTQHKSMTVQIRGRATKVSLHRDHNKVWAMDGKATSAFYSKTMPTVREAKYWMQHPDFN